MGDLSRGETREAFAPLVNQLPEGQRIRAWQLLEAVVFKAAPILVDIHFLGKIIGSGPPSDSDFSSDGIALYYDADAATGYFVWIYQSTAMAVELT